MIGTWTLHVLDGPLKGTTKDIGSRPLRVGRSAENDVHLPDKAASRRHAEFTITTNGVVVTDLGARNPTLVNDKVVAGSRALKPGDVIEIGSTQFRITISGSEQVAVPDAATPAASVTPTPVPTPTPEPPAVPAPAGAAAPAPAAARATEATDPGSESSPLVRYFFFATVLLAGLFYLVIGPALNNRRASPVERTETARGPTEWDAQAAADAVRRRAGQAGAAKESAEYGMFYYALGRYDEAAKVWARHALSSPGAQERAERAEYRWRVDWEEHRAAGLTDARLGNLDGARRHLAIALRMAQAHGEHEAARELEEMLRGLGPAEGDIR